MDEHFISYLYYPEGHMPCDEYAAKLEEQGLAPVEFYFSPDDLTALNTGLSYPEPFEEQPDFEL